MFDPPITTAANIFVIVAVCLIAVGAAITVVDIYKGTVQKKKQASEKK
jgi:hypothetical protein